MMVLSILKTGTNWTKREIKITYLSPNGAILISPGAAPQEIQVMTMLSIYLSIGSYTGYTQEWNKTF
jgi:hypothetical protein